MEDFFKHKTVVILTISFLLLLLLLLVIQFDINEKLRIKKVYHYEDIHPSSIKVLTIDGDTAIISNSTTLITIRKYLK